MILTYRCRQIVKKMIDAKRPLRIKELAEEFQVSIRAIKYDIELIRLWMEKPDHAGMRLESKTNRGIWLEGDKTAINRLITRFKQDEKQQVVLSQDERVKYIIMALTAADDYITISNLEDKTSVSRNTVVSDLQEVERFFQHWHAVLERKVHRGLKVRADEPERRLILEYILQGFLTSKDMSVLLQSLIQDTEIPSRIDQMMAPISLEPQDIECIYQTIRQVVRQARTSTGHSLSERAVLGLFIRFCVMVQRIRTDHSFASSPAGMSFSPNALYIQVRQECDALADCLGIAISESEIQYIWPQWLGVFGQTVSAPGAGSEPFHIITITNRLIGGVSRLAKVPFHEDTELFDNLLAHLTDRLAKYQCRALDPNPLVAEIIRTYGALFEKVKQVCLDVLKDINIFLNDADIAYLVLHFQAAVERRCRGHMYKALVVCGTGRGSARLLKIRLENEFKNLQVIGCCSVLEIDKVLDRYAVDVVISVLPIDISYPTVVINAIPTREDFSMIRQILKTMSTDTVPQVLIGNDNFLASLTVLKSGLNARDLPVIEALSQEIMNQGFQLATLITTEFRQYLTAQAAAGLTIHILLMVNRLAFGSPYAGVGFGGQVENEQTAALRERLNNLLKEHYAGIPASEVSIILRYFSYEGDR